MPVAREVPSDGSVVVGLAFDGCQEARAFRWEESTGIVDLGTVLEGRFSRANGVSGDGRVVVGWSTNARGRRQGVKWVDGAGEAIFGPSGQPVGEARAANSDGSIIVGQGCDEPGLAWVWTAEAGVQCTGVDPGIEEAFESVQAIVAVSDDGRVAGGSLARGAATIGAVIWIDGSPQFLEDYLESFGLDPFRDWFGSGQLTAVSADGRVVAGWGAGPTNFQGYVIALPD